MRPRQLRRIIGRSEWAQQVRAFITAAAPYLVQRDDHRRQRDGQGIDCPGHSRRQPPRRPAVHPGRLRSITGTLFASHMFGHVKGAFTGAAYAALGCFRAADGGTIFLNEIGELELELQAKLLRVVQERVVVPVGSHDGEPVNVRIIAATNRDLQREVSRRTVPRGPLLPPQRGGHPHPPPPRAAGGHRPAGRALPRRVRVGERPAGEAAVGRRTGADAALSLAGQCPRAAEHPGAGGAFHRGRGDRPGSDTRGAAEDATQPVSPQALALQAIAVPGGQPLPAGPAAGPPSSQDQRWPTVAEVERDHIRHTLEHTDHNQSLAARLLGIDRHLLRRRIISYGLDVSRSRQGRPSLRVRAGNRAA